MALSGGVVPSQLDGQERGNGSRRSDEDGHQTSAHMLTLVGSGNQQDYGCSVHGAALVFGSRFLQLPQVRKELGREVAHVQTLNAQVSLLLSTIPKAVCDLSQWCTARCRAERAAGEGSLSTKRALASNAVSAEQACVQANNRIRELESQIEGAAMSVC